VHRVRSVIAVTQRFHLPRTLWLADRAGLQATGLEANRSDYGWDGWYAQGREVLARVKAVGDVALGTDPQIGPDAELTLSAALPAAGPVGQTGRNECDRARADESCLSAS
jgi:SanA protein